MQLQSGNKGTCLVGPSCSLPQDVDRASLRYITSPDNGQGQTLHQALSQTFRTKLSLNNKNITRLHRTRKGSATHLRFVVVQRELG